MMQKVTIDDPGDTRFLEKESVSKIDFMEEIDWIYDKKVVTDLGESPNLKAGQIISISKLRDENAQLKRKDLKLSEVRTAHKAPSRPLQRGTTRDSRGRKTITT